MRLLEKEKLITIEEGSDSALELNCASRRGVLLLLVRFIAPGPGAVSRVSSGNAQLGKEPPCPEEICGKNQDDPEPFRH